MIGLLLELFYWLFNMSISTSIVGILIFLLYKTRKIPSRVTKILWGIPFLRMWIPIGINSPYSIMSLIAKLTSATSFIYESTPKTVLIYENFLDGYVLDGYERNLSFMNFIQATDTYFPIVYKATLVKNIFLIGSVCWIVVTAMLLIMIIIIYVEAMLEIKEAIYFRDNIYISEKITSPTTYGIVHEKIILPKRYEEEDLKFILLHENAHIKAKDNLLRIIVIITTCIHWFNPLSWLFLKSFLENLELACDEAVLKQCDDADKKNYAKTLLSCTEKKSLCASAFGGAKVRVRMKRILSYKKLSVLSIISFTVLALVIGYICLTNAI